MKMGDFTILTPKEPIFDEIDFGQKITKNTIKEKACAKNQGFKVRKRSQNDFTKSYCFLCPVCNYPSVVILINYNHFEARLLSFHEMWIDKSRPSFYQI